MPSPPQRQRTILEVTCRLKHFGFARYRRRVDRKQGGATPTPSSIARPPSQRGAPAGSALSGSHTHTYHVQQATSQIVNDVEAARAVHTHAHEHALPLKSCLGLAQDATQQQHNDNTHTQTQTHVPMCECTCIMYMCMYTGGPKPQHRPIAHIRQARLCALGQWEGQHFCRARHCHAPCFATSRWT